MAGSPIWRGTPRLVQQYSGPSLKLADRIVDRDIYRGPINLCRSGALLRGTFGTDDRLGWVVTNSDVDWESRGIGTLTINWEVGGPFAPDDLRPLDDWREEVVELYPKVERNQNLHAPTDSNNKIAPSTIDACYQAYKGHSLDFRTQATTFLQSMNTKSSAPPAGSTWEDQKVFGLKLLGWLQDGHETYYLAGIKYSYIRHFFSMPTTTRGGYIEVPTLGPRAGCTDLSWLRLCDNVEPVGVNGSAFKVTSQWLGGPDGHWDYTLYT
ncbi:MAG: hypothetical protein NT154_05230 [Verrucomicrobia bacterium]|nr:hypothetical protein [Verrucomicrobiota bacterium]